MIIDKSKTGECPVAGSGPPPKSMRRSISEGEDRQSSSDFNEQHFSTDHLLANLKGRTISSGFITMMSQGTLFALNLGSAIVLARLLTPQDFGLVVMVMSVLGFFRIFKEAGLSTATVQREGITHAQVSNLFWINVGLSGLITLLVAAFAPVIAWFFREPRLVGVTLALSTTFLLAGLTVQHQALLNRQMRFKVIAMIQIGSMMAGIVVGVGMAWLNYGYWSLVGMTLSTPLVAFLLTWSASPWRPRLPKLRSGTRPLLNFGFNLAAGDFIGSLARGIDGPLIGRFFGATSVGLYSRAAVLLMRPTELFTGAIASVITPTLSRLQSQPDRYRSTFLQLYDAVALIGSVFTSLLLVLAHPLTLMVLGPKWEAASGIFAAFTIGAYCYLLTTLSTWLFASQGRGQESMFAISIVSVLTAVSYLFGLPYGPIGVAIAFSIAGLLFHVPILFYMAGRHGPVTMNDLLAGFFRHLPVWGVVWASTSLAHILVANSACWVQLEICVPVGLLAGFCFICIFPPSRAVALNLYSTLRSLNGATKASVA